MQQHATNRVCKRTQHLTSSHPTMLCPFARGVRGSLHGVGRPQVGEVTCGESPHLSCKRDQIEMRDYMDRWVTPPKRVTSPTWGPPPPCKQALRNIRLKPGVNLRTLLQVQFSSVAIVLESKKNSNTCYLHLKNFPKLTSVHVGTVT